MSITDSLALWMAPVSEDKIREVMKLFPGPYRLLMAHKDEDQEREFPWIVVGASGVNMFGRLWPKGYATAVLHIVERIAKEGQQ